MLGADLQLLPQQRLLLAEPSESGARCLQFLGLRAGDCGLQRCVLTAQAGRRGQQEGDHLGVVLLLGLGQLLAEPGIGALLKCQLRARAPHFPSLRRVR